LKRSLADASEKIFNTQCTTVPTEVCNCSWQITERASLVLGSGLYSMCSRHHCNAGGATASSKSKSWLFSGRVKREILFGEMNLINKQGKKGPHV